MTPTKMPIWFKALLGLLVLLDLKVHLAKEAEEAREAVQAKLP